MFLPISITRSVRLDRFAIYYSSISSETLLFLISNDFRLKFGACKGSNPYKDCILLWERFNFSSFLKVFNPYICLILFPDKFRLLSSVKLDR